MSNPTCITKCQEKDSSNAKEGYISISKLELIHILQTLDGLKKKLQPLLTNSK